MANYQRYQPRRRTYRSSSRRWSLIGWSAAGLIVLVLAWNGFGGSGTSGNANQNRNAEITLSGGTNQNGNTNASVAASEGREFTVRDCTKAISTATTTKPYVALTLNAGGIAGQSQQLVETLKQNNIPATLFVTGQWAEEHAEIAKAYADAGFDVFSRGYNRTAYSTLTATQIGTDLDKADAAVVDATEKSSQPFIRPPGEVSSAVLSTLTAQGYCPILWTVDALDVQNDATVTSSVERVSKALKNGAIIVMGANSDLALELAPAIAAAAQDKGFTLVSLRDLLRVSPSATNANANTNSGVKANSNTNRTTHSAD